MKTRLSCGQAARVDKTISERPILCYGLRSGEYSITERIKLKSDMVVHFNPCLDRRRAAWQAWPQRVEVFDTCYEVHD